MFPRLPDKLPVAASLGRAHGCERWRFPKHLNLACTWQQPITVQNGPIGAGSPGAASQLSHGRRETHVRVIPVTSTASQKPLDFSVGGSYEKDLNSLPLREMSLHLPCSSWTRDRNPSHLISNSHSGWLNGRGLRPSGMGWKWNTYQYKSRTPENEQSYTATPL